MRYGPDEPDATYVPHACEEQLFDTGEVFLDYAAAGQDAPPALLLVPWQTGAWWGHEAAMGLLVMTQRWDRRLDAAHSRTWHRRLAPVSAARG